MCGRYTLAAEPVELIEAFDVPDLTFDLVARYNVAPSQEAPIVAEDGRGRRLGLMRWGLKPGWRDDPGSGFINARAESIRTTRSFREAFERRRCLVPADGFYEWRREGRTRTPFWLHPTGGSLLSFAGVWERWARPGVEPHHTFAIVTTTANADLRPIHDRMPILISPEDRGVWLARASALDAVERLLAPPPDGTLEAREVSTRVNRPSEDYPGLIEPVG